MLFLRERSFRALRSFGLIFGGPLGAYAPNTLPKFQLKRSQRHRAAVLRISPQAAIRVGGALAWASVGLHGASTSSINGDVG